MERTLIILKPDCTATNLIGEVISRFEVAGFKVLNMRMENASYDQLFKHYEGIGQLKTRLVADGRAHAFDEVMEFMQSGPVVPILFEREDAIAEARRLAGSTRPWQAEKGTIRYDFGRHDPDLPIENVIHASANEAEAKQEIALWFPENFNQ